MDIENDNAMLEQGELNTIPDSPTADIYHKQPSNSCLINSNNQHQADEVGQTNPLETITPYMEDEIYVEKPAFKHVDPKKQIVAIDFNDFLAMKFPPMTPILTPWLCKGHISMVHAWRGVGKTNFSLGIAFAVASGGEYLKWSAPQPFRVVYIDGEMSGEAMQERLKLLEKNNFIQPDRGYLKIITPDSQPSPLPDLATPEGQAAINLVIADAELIIVDNLSCLMRTGDENKAEGWNTTAEWALNLRRKNKTLLFVAHDGKSGQRRGSSKVEDIMDTVLQLTHEADYNPEKGAGFTCHFKKGRHLTGEDQESIEATLDKDTGIWEWKVAEKAMTERIKKLKLEVPNMSQTEIALELGCNKSTVCRALKQ